MHLSIIVAIAQNNAIGYQNKLIYFIKEDLKRFKQLTTGHTIIMGRRTFESLPKGALPNRRNIVLSRSEKSFLGCDVYSSLQEALASCHNDEHVYIIGGVSVYKEALTIANELCLTEIEATPKNADTFFPLFDRTLYTETFCEEHEATDDHPAFRFVNLERRK